MNNKIIKLDIKGSKSIINRVLIITTFLKSVIKLHNFSDCQDVATMLNSLKQLGYGIEIKADTCVITPQINKPKFANIFIKDAGTALRFLLSRLSVWDGLESEVKISEQLQKRPNKILLELLRKSGAVISTSYPWKIFGRELDSIKGTIPAHISSQFISSIMLVAPAFQNGIDLKFETKPVSLDYLKLTAKIMSDFGVATELTDKGVKIDGNQKYQLLSEYYIEPDYSSASYFWALGALTPLWIGIKVPSNNSAQSDFLFPKKLKKIGAEIDIRKDFILVKRGRIKGSKLDMTNMPDQVPTLVFLALFAENETKISGISHLKYKESDRISALIKELKKIGARLEQSEDKLIVYPLKKPVTRGVVLHTYNDHRLVMVFSLLKLIFPIICLDDVSPVIKSFPNFFSELNKVSENLDIKKMAKDITNYE